MGIRRRFEDRGARTFGFGVAARCSIALVLLAAGCASTGAGRGADSQGPTARDYVPLAIGNSWTYVSKVGERLEQNQVRIDRLQQGFYLDNHGGGLRLDAEGLRDERRYLLHLPLEVGHRWESLLPGGLLERYEIVETEATIEVPAGRFSRVIQVRGITRLDPRTELEIEWSWAPGVGLVRIATTAVIDGKKRVEQPSNELSSFVIAPEGTSDPAPR